MNKQPIPDPEVSTDGQVTWSESGEEYFYDSLQEVLESVHGLSVGSVVYHGTKSHPDASAFVDVDAIIDTISDSAHGSDYSEWAEGYPEISTEAREELEALVEAWARKHCQPNFFLVKNAQAYTITAEDLARHAQQVEPVAGEERHQAIMSMIKDCPHATYGMLGDLYDAGYRKQVAP